MSSPPEIIKVLRTADDWTDWIDQVKICLLSLDWKDYITTNAAGEPGFTPPRAPTPPHIDGILGTHSGLQNGQGSLGERKLLQWSYERELARYETSKREYDAFILAVKGSIAVDAGFNLSEERNFKELIGDLKAHLKVDDLITRPKFEEIWKALMRQSLKEMPVAEWGENIIEANRLLRERGSKVVSGWEPYFEFVDNVNESYPVVAPAIYFRLYDMQRRAEKLQVAEPPGTGFETFVRANVAMISRLAERGTTVNESSAGETQTGTTPLPESLARAGKEPQRAEAASVVPEQIRSRDEQNNEHATSSQAPEAKIGQRSEQTAPPKPPKPGNKEHGNRDTTRDTPTRKGLDQHRWGDAPIQIAGLASQGYKQGNAPTEAAMRTTQNHRQSNTPTEGGKQKEAAERAAVTTAGEPPIQENGYGNAPMEALRRAMEDHRREDASAESWKRATEVDKQKEAAERAAQAVAWNRSIQDKLMETMERTTQDRRQENALPNEAVNRTSQDHRQKDSLLAKPVQQEYITQLKQEHINPYDFFGLTATEAPHNGEAPDAPSEMTFRAYQREQTPGISLKRKIEGELHEGRDLIQDHPSVRVRQGRDEMAAARDSPERGCRICLNGTHTTTVCTLLKRYQKNPNAAKLSFGAKKRCRAWLQGDDTTVGGDVEVEAYRCGVCLSPGHGPSSCADLRVYRKFGLKTRGLQDEIMARCEEWLWRENKFRGQERSL